MSDFNTQVIEEFRANGGKVGGPFEGAPMILMQTIGAKSGQVRTIPLVYSTDGDRLVVIASKGGAPTNPDWYFNLVTHPEITVEVGAETFKVNATEVHGEERDRLYAAQAEIIPGFLDYEKKAAGIRTIPVFVLERA